MPRATRCARKVTSLSKRLAAERDKAEKKRLTITRLEKEPPLHHRVTALINADYPGKRRASTAYDDRVCKRRKTKFIGMPWDDEPENGIEKPFFPYLGALLPKETDQAASGTVDWVEAVAMGLCQQDPTGAMGDLAKLPTEIRDKIFRHLLVHVGYIRVLRGWSLLFPRSRPNLQTAILSTCRAFYREGVRILYGENTFMYLTRDLPEARDDTDVIIKHVYENDQIPIDKHGHLIRNIKIIVEANRMQLFQTRQSLQGALQKFLSGHGLITPAQLHTVTIELPAQTRVMLGMPKDAGTSGYDVPAAEWFRSDSPTLMALKNLNCQFIRIVASDIDGDKYEALIDRRPHFTELSADEGGSDIWSRDKLMLEGRKRSAAGSRGRLGSLYYWLGRLATEPLAALSDGPFRCYIPDAENVEPLQQLPSASSQASSRASATIARQRLAMGALAESLSNSYLSSGDQSEHGVDEEDDSMFVPLIDAEVFQQD